MDVRKKWLNSLIAINVATALYSLVGAFLGVHLGVSTLINVLVTMLFNVSISMHCSYISRGTRWLAFMAILYPLTLLLGAFLLLKSLIMAEPIFYTNAGNLVLSPFILYFARMCYLLRAQYLKERSEGTSLEEATTT